MKRNTIFIAVILLLMGGNAYAKGAFWKAVGKAVGHVAAAAAGVVMEQAVEHSGYKPEEAKQMTHNFFENIGVNTANVDRGLNYITAGDKSTRQNVVSNMVFDEVIDASGSEIISSIKAISNARFDYRNDYQKATTQEERQAVFDTLMKNYAYIAFDAYEVAQQRKAKRISERLQIERQMIDKGISSERANDIAGTILAVEKSPDLTEQEKLDYFKVFGFTQTPEQIEEVAQIILDEDEQIETPVGPTPEEIAAKEEAERREKERIAKENAIDCIQSTIVNEYAFDSTELNDEQKESLDKIAEILNKYPEFLLQIKGHTCNIGYQSVNERVGLRRADTAKSYLIEKGISSDRISTLSGGEYEPMIENNSNENRKLNRRLTFTIQ